MHRHQGHLVQGFVLGHVGIGKQRNILQEVPQVHHRQLGSLYQRGVRHHAVLHQRIHIVPVHFLHIALDAVQELLHVLEAGLALHRIVGLEEQVNAAFRGQRHGHIVRIAFLCLGRCLAHHVAESADFGDRRAPQAEGFQVGPVSRLEKRHPALPRSIGKR